MIMARMMMDGVHAFEASGYVYQLPITVMPFGLLRGNALLQTRRFLAIMRWRAVYAVPTMTIKVDAGL